MQKTLFDELRLKLIEQTRLRDEEIDSYSSRAMDIGYWRKLIPQLSIGGDAKPETVEAPSIGLSGQRELLDGLARTGYLQTNPFLSASVIGQMRQCVEILKAEGWPPLFAFVFDVFWLVWRAPSLVQLLSAALGPGYKLIPHVWCYYVHATRGASGWTPHADGLGMARRLTIWIPLGHATLDNGCIYLIPKDLLPKEISIDSILNSKTITNEQAAHLLRSSRALPAEIGSALGWDFEVIHWGSMCHEAGDPRISISAEFIGEDSDPMDDELPLIDPHAAPLQFLKRLHVIAKAILIYHEREARMFRYLELAKRVLKDVESV